MARKQAQIVGVGLGAALPGLRVSYRFLDGCGDRIPDRPLAEIGRKGLFTEDLERALAAGDIDIAVHSLKDLPTGQSVDATLAAVGRRETGREALVVPRGGLETGGGGGSASGEELLRLLPRGAVIGTSSLRRECQITRARPDIRIRPVRGNVGTRLSKLDEGRFDALVLALAGLRRLGVDRPAAAFGPEWLPAPGQGALAVQCLPSRREVWAAAAHLDHEETRAEVLAERALAAGLGADCRTPVAARARVDTDTTATAETGPATLTIRAAVYDVGGGPPAAVSLKGTAAMTGSTDAPGALGRAAAMELLEAGGGEYVARARDQGAS